MHVFGYGMVFRMSVNINTECLVNTNDLSYVDQLNTNNFEIIFYKLK